MEFIANHINEILIGWAILSVPASLLFGACIRAGGAGSN